MKRNGRPTPRAPFLAAAILVSAAALTAGCSSGGGSDTSTAAAHLTGTPYKIFSINDDSAATPYPEVISAGNQAVAYVNANGGINGHPLQIEFCKSQVDPNATAACANRAIADPSVVATTGNFMGLGDGAVKALSEAGVPQLSPLAVAQAEYSCPVCFNTNGGALVSVLGETTVLTDVVHAKRLAFLGVDIPAGRALPDLLSQVLKATRPSTQIVSTQFVPINAADFNGVVAGLQNSNADAVIMAIPLNLQLSFLRAASSLGMDKPLGTNLTINLLPQLDSVGSAAQNLRFATFYRHDLPGYRTFLDQMTKNDKDVGTDDVSANMWDSVNLFAKLARSTPDVTRQSILDAARKLTTYDSGMMAQPVDFKATFSGLGGAYPGLNNTRVYYAHLDDGKVVHDLDGRAVDVFQPVAGG